MDSMKIKISYLSNGFCLGVIFQSLIGYSLPSYSEVGDGLGESGSSSVAEAVNIQSSISELNQSMDMIGKSTIEKAKVGRALLVISELDQRGVKELRPIYKTLESLAWSIPTQMPTLSSVYTHFKLVRDQRATIEGSQKALVSLLENPTVSHVDVVLGVHGLINKIYFIDGPIEAEQWVEGVKSKLSGDPSSQLKALSKLGLLYNLSCYGSSHSKAFLNLGFQVVVGSRSVNANAELEYPWVFHWLSLGYSIKSAFAQPNSREWLYIADAPLRWLGQQQNSFLQETNSFKVIKGKKNYTIRD